MGSGPRGWMTASASRTDGEIEDASGSVTTAPVMTGDRRHISAWQDRMRSAATTRTPLRCGSQANRCPLALATGHGRHSQDPIVPDMRRRIVRGILMIADAGAPTASTLEE